MATEKIAAETRTEFGKGAARRIRRDDKIPAVLYGHGNDPVHVTLPGHDTMMALKHGGANALLELDIEGSSQLGSDGASYVVASEEELADAVAEWLDPLAAVEEARHAAAARRGGRRPRPGCPTRRRRDRGRCPRTRRAPSGSGTARCAAAWGAG